MKKQLFALAAILLAVFIAGCGKTPDEELTEKIPASADSLCFVDVNSFIRTKLYRDHQKDILKGLKDASLPEDVLQCRMLIFVSTKEEWGGAVLQSSGGQVRKFYDRALAETKKDKDCKDLKETTEGGLRKVTCTVEGKKVLAVLYHDNFLLVAVGKTDPALFAPKSANPLLKEISLQGMLLSAVSKVELPPQGKSQEIDSVGQMFPALKKLKSVIMNVPFSEDKPEMDFRAVLADDAAANEMLATINMGLGLLTQSKDKDIMKAVEMIKRKAEKNTVVVSFPITELVKQFEESLKKE